MKIVLLILILFLIVSLVFAGGYTMKVNLRNGVTDTSLVADISKITFQLDPLSIGESTISAAPGSFRLLSNYPNPFNPSTQIQYELPKSGLVEISIYEINGSLIRILESQNQAGKHQIVWDGKNEAGQRVASGHYLYNVKFENTVLSGKMILLKYLITEY